MIYVDTKQQNTKDKKGYIFECTKNIDRYRSKKNQAHPKQ